MHWFVSLAIIAACACSSAIAQTEDERGIDFAVRGAIDDREPTNNAMNMSTSVILGSRSAIIGQLSISPVGDVDYLRVFAQAGEAILIMTCPLGGLPNNFDTPDTLVEIFDSGGVELISDDDAAASFPGGASDGSIVRFVAPEVGSYTIRVSELGNNGTGPYALMISRLSVEDYFEQPSEVITNPAVLGHALAGPLLGKGSMTAGNLDFYAFDLNPGDVILAAVTGVEGLPANFNTPNCTMRLIGPDQVTVLDTSVDDGGGNLPGGLNSSDNPSIVFRAPSQGRFYIELTSNTVSGAPAHFFTSALIPAAYCPGDADGSGNVAFLDITTVLANFGNACP
jgi:hypothetical protein